jgi:hypothetical protein
MAFIRSVLCVNMSLYAKGLITEGVYSLVKAGKHLQPMSPFLYTGSFLLWVRASNVVEEYICLDMRIILLCQYSFYLFVLIAICINICTAFMVINIKNRKKDCIFRYWNSCKTSLIFVVM